MKFDLTLYLVTDSTGLDEKTFLSRVEAACRGGVTLVQLREKNCGGREMLRLARAVKEITDRYEIPLLIDDRIDVAMAIDCAGVHVGQSDLPVAVARLLLGPDKIVGATAKTVEQAAEAKAQGADYLGVGAIYPTATKTDTVCTEVSMLTRIVREVGLPVVAIGGLKYQNCDILAGAPFSGIAVVSALMAQEDPETAAQKLKQKVESIRGE